jgi:hypothetical protein
MDSYRVEVKSALTIRLPDTGPPPSGVAGPWISWDLFAPDLQLVRFPSFTDLDALPTLPLITFSFAAWC